MSKRGSVRDYSNGRKNHWRRTVWNDVLQRTELRAMRDEFIRVWLERGHEARFYTYKSGANCFDSVVFQMYWERTLIGAPAWLVKEFEQHESGGFVPGKVLKVVRKIAATLAVRTMRVRAEAHV